MASEHGEFDLELRHLRVFEVLLREHSLTRAAEVLGVTQPALSKTLAALRGYFSDPLFVRVGQRMEPTAKALHLSTAVREILDQLTSLRTAHVPFHPAVTARTFRFSSVDSGTIRQLPALIRAIGDRAPKVRLQIMPLDVARLESSLESGKLDFATGSFPGLSKRIRRQFLWSVSYVGVARHDHPRLKDKPTLKAFAAEKHVLVYSAGTGHAHLRTERALEKALPNDHIVCKVPSFVSAAVLVGMSDLVATLPAGMAQTLAPHLGLKIFPVPLRTPSIDIYQYWHERFHRDPGNEWIRELFAELFTRPSSHPESDTTSMRRGTPRAANRATVSR
jgi:DNA-binding transcriptional LysR family regulator